MFNSELFIKATREKMRFPYKGLISVEKLWDLPLSELDSIYKNLNANRKTAQEESLLDTRTEKDETLEAQIDIIKYIVSVKLDEKKAAEKAKEHKDRRQRILEIKANREDEKLKNLPDEELDKLLEDLK